jgi:hypothetical protein
MYTYSIDQMGEFLGVQGPEMRPTKTGKRNPNFRGHVQRWHQTYIAFNQLRQIRGGSFGEGCRHWACYILALIQTKIGMKAADIQRDCLDLARQCRPPLSESDAVASIRSGIRSRKLFRELTIMKSLRVTAQERDQIPHWQGAANNPTRPLPLSERDQVILRVIADIGFTPSLRTMQRQLVRNGYSCSVESIRGSYRRLNQSQTTQNLFDYGCPSNLELNQNQRLDAIKGTSSHLIVSSDNEHAKHMQC